MLRAKLKSGEFVTLARMRRKEIQAIRSKHDFYCPECNEQVIVKAGEQVIAHFAHKRDSTCSNQEHGEGVYHAKGKLLLYNWLKQQGINAVLEVYLPEIKQRPDILIYLGKKRIALEYQCAKTSTAEIRKRNEGYEKIGITPIWILGAKQFKRRSNTRFDLNSFTLQFLHQFARGFPTTLYYLCPHSLQLSTINDIYIISNRRAIGKINFRKLSEINFLDLFNYDIFSNEQLYSIWYFRQKNFRLQERGRAFGSELKYRYWLYEQGIYHHELPSIVNLPVRSQFLMKVPHYNWQSRLVIELLNPLATNAIFHYARLKKDLSAFMHHPNHYPLLKHSLHPIYEYLLVLVDLNILEKLPNDSFKKKAPIKFPKTIDEALKADENCLDILQRESFYRI